MAFQLPIFPLNIVVFPQETLNLHIFEPRYKQLINECETTGIHFGIPAFLEKRLMTIGTEIKLLEIVKRYPNGEMDIRTEALDRFEIKEIHRPFAEKLYTSATVERVYDSIMLEENSTNEQIMLQIKELFSILKVEKKLPSNLLDFHLFQYAHYVGFSLAQEYEFLCLEGEQLRQEFMSKHLQKLIPIVRETENLKTRVQLNGHFKNIPPLNE